MPESIEEYHARVMAAADREGRLAIDSAQIPNWDVFPFEPAGLRLKPIEPLAQAEEPRHGEDPKDCDCAGGEMPDEVVWRDEAWWLQAFERSGAPLVMMLSPIEHVDFTGLPPTMAGQMGRLMVALGAAIEALPSVARVHVRWGDGGAHAHIFFFARPARMPQLRGTCLALWDDFLPPVPAEVVRENADAVVGRLVATCGGQAVRPSTT